MWRDSIVAEVRKIRGRHAAAFNYDLDAIFQDLKKQEKDILRNSWKKNDLASGGKVYFQPCIFLVESGL